MLVMKIKATEKNSYHYPKKRNPNPKLSRTPSCLTHFLGVSNFLQTNKRIGETKILDYALRTSAECVLGTNAYIVG